MFLEFLNLCASAGRNPSFPSHRFSEDSEKQLVNFGVIGPLLSKIMDDEWNERAQVLGFKAIGCLSIDRDVRAYLGVCNEFNSNPTPTNTTTCPHLF